MSFHYWSFLHNFCGFQFVLQFLIQFWSTECLKFGHFLLTSLMNCDAPNVENSAQSISNGLKPWLSLISPNERMVRILIIISFDLHFNQCFISMFLTISSFQLFDILLVFATWLIIWSIFDSDILNYIHIPFHFDLHFHFSFLNQISI